MADQTGQGANSQKAARAGAEELSLFMFVSHETFHFPTGSLLTQSSAPQAVVKINVKGKAFIVQKALLVKDSRYFEVALNGPFAEAQTQTIDLGDDIRPIQFGIYVDVLYRSYVVSRYEFRPPLLDLNTAAFHTESTQAFGSLSQVLWLWRLSDRFLNDRLVKIAEDAFNWCASWYTVSKWEEKYANRKFTDKRLFDQITTLERAYHHCVQYNLPQKDEIVQCAANMPLQLFTKHHHELGDDFRTAVTMRVMKRFENPELKRPSEGDDGGAPPAKRVKTT